LVEHGLGFQAAELLKMDTHLLLAKLKGSLGTLAYEVASTLRLLECVDDEVRMANARMVAVGAGRQEIELASSIPGVEFTLAFTMLSVIGDVRRFESADALANSSGLTPTLWSSGPGKPKHGRLTKRGSKLLRWAAVEAAKNAVKSPGRFKNRYQKMRRKGKPYGVAIAACARQLLEVMWHVLSKKETYRELPQASQARKQRRRAITLQKAGKALKTAPDARRCILNGLGTLRELLNISAA
jgi:transposase